MYITVIKSLEELPYPIKLIEKVAYTRFKEEFEMKFEMAIAMSNVIRGIAESNDHYVLMPDSIDIYKEIIKYPEIKLYNPTLDEFTERKKNRAYRHKVGFIDTPLGTMETWYCSEGMGKLFNVASSSFVPPIDKEV